METAYHNSNANCPTFGTIVGSDIAMTWNYNSLPHLLSQRSTVSSNSQCENVFEQLFVTTRKLGFGAQGTVYECTERSLCTYRYKENGGTFAVKIINTDGLTQEKIARLENELQLLNQINGEAHVLSTQIVQVFHAYEIPKYTYILMERMLGGTLTKWHSERKSCFVAESDTQRICRSLFEALEFCHQRKIAHRDIKPCNLLLATNELTSLKIADFGLAKVVPENGGLRSLCGTLHFMPPEMMLRGTVRYDTKCDVWSAGVVVYMLLTGMSPFPSVRNRDELFQEILFGDINFDGLQVSDQANAFVRASMTRLPRKRWTATEALKSSWMI